MITSKINNLKYVFNSKQNIVRPHRPNQSQIVSCIHNIRFNSLNMSSITIFDGKPYSIPQNLISQKCVSFISVKQFILITRTFKI